MTSPKKQPRWSAEEIAFVTEIGENLRAEQIIPQLKAKFGTDRSKHAVQLKLNELIPQKSETEKRHTGTHRHMLARISQKQRQTQTNEPPMDHMSRAEQTRIKKAFERPKDTQQLKTFNELKLDSECKWLFGEPSVPETYGYCGHKITTRPPRPDTSETADVPLPYCPYHVGLAYRPSSDRAEARKTAALQHRRNQAKLRKNTAG